MDKKLFDSLDEPLKEKLRNCKSNAEMQKIIAESGMQELSVDMLEGVSGGNAPCICPKATDCTGQKCISFAFQ